MHTILATGFNEPDKVSFYNVVLFLHILSAIVGIGGVTLNGLYAAQAQKRQGPTGRAVSEANYTVTNVAEKVIQLPGVRRGNPLLDDLAASPAGGAWRGLTAPGHRGSRRGRPHRTRTVRPG